MKRPDRLRLADAARSQARSADAALLDRLAVAGWLGRVHSVFARTVNIETASGTLVTLAARECDDAPDTIVVDAPGFAGWDVAAGDVVMATPSAIAIGDRLHVRLAGARAWRDDLARSFDPARLRANLEVLEARLAADGTAGGMLAGASAPDAWTGEVTRALAAGRAQVRLALSRGDRDAFRAHAASLIGLGPGLTPSGDDFLVGLFAALHVEPGAAASFAPLCVAISEEAATRTNGISLAALRHAAAGRVRDSIAQLLHQLCAGDPERLTAALERVLAIGSTSGTDIVAGVACGAGIHLERAASTQRPLTRVPAPHRRAEHTIS